VRIPLLCATASLSVEFHHPLRDLCHAFAPGSHDFMGFTDRLTASFSPKALSSSRMIALPPELRTFGDRKRSETKTYEF